MTLPASGSITGALIRAELGQTGGDLVFGDGITRFLADAPTGSIILPASYYGKLSVKIVDTKFSGGEGSPFTFTGVNFGPAFPSRKLIACTCLRGNVAAPLDISSVVIGGVGAVGLDTGEYDGSVANGAGIFSASVPNGTSGNVTLTWSGQASSAGGLILLSVSNVPTAAYDSSASSMPGGGGGAISDNVDVPANGVVVMATCHANANAATLTGVTKRQEINCGGTMFAVGFDNRQSPQANKAFSASWSGSVARGFMVRSYVQG